MGCPTGLENRLARFIIELDFGYEHDLLVVSQKIHQKLRINLQDVCNIYHYKYNKFYKKPAFLRPILLKRWLKNRSEAIVICYSQLSQPRLLETVFENQRSATRIYYEGGILWHKPASFKSLLSRFDLYVANSTGSKIILRDKFAIPAEKITVIFNGIPRNYCDESQGSFILNSQNQAATKSTKGFSLLYLGRLVPKKAVNVLIRAMQYLPIDYHLMIVGDGTERAPLQRLARKLAVSEKVTFHGFKLDPRPFLKMADVLVVPSVSEPMGNVVLEGAAFGLPIVASAVDGNCDILVHGQSGVLISPTVSLEEMQGDFSGKHFPTHVTDPFRDCLMPPRLIEPIKLAEWITRIREDENLRKKLATGARLRVMSKFLMKDTVSQFNCLLQNIHGS